MLNSLEKLDQELFLFLNGFHNFVFDFLMYWISEMSVWIPFYALIVGLIIWKYKWKSVFIIVTLVLVITSTDQLTSSFMKPFFERLRPCHNPDIQHLVHIVKKCGGTYGFASSHAANTFGFAMFIWLVFKNNFKYVWLIFLWSTLISYSRVYLGVHYPGDIIIGAILGMLLGYIIFALYKWLIDKLINNNTRS